MESFDAIVVGSGFGGSVSAYRLAEAGQRVVVLERGKAYPPGSFARTPYEMRRNFWDPSEGHHGLFQVWGFRGIDAIVSSGLGGGSLIYANVLLRLPERWFTTERTDGTFADWPVTRADLDPHYDRVESVLTPVPYPFGTAPFSDTPKTTAFFEAARAAGHEPFLPPIAVTFADRSGAPIPGEPILNPDGTRPWNLHERTRRTCRLCGECDVGCNDGAKNTLDYNYLSMAKAAGADLRTRCEVRGMRPADGGGYVVSYVEHLPEHEGSPTDTAALPLQEVRAAKLVLAAGTFGTNFLLQRNRQNFHLSSRLGHGFSGNGDILGLLQGATVRTSSGQTVPRHIAPSHGPVITSALAVSDRRDGGSGPGYYIEDAGFPLLFSWFQQAATRGTLTRAGRYLLHRLSDFVRSDPPTDWDFELGNILGDTAASDSFVSLLGMGRDIAGGEFSLSPHGYLKLSWNERDSAAFFDEVRSTMRTMATALGARFSDNPTWYFRKLITVHALGGCAMGRSAADGVVDAHGEVFGHPGFFIADGSVVPGPIGPNPSLTIAALADRFADRMVESA